MTLQEENSTQVNHLNLINVNGRLRSPFFYGEKMELHQIFPESSRFKLEIENKIVEIRLRKVSLRDHVFCMNLFNMELSEALGSIGGDVDKICKLVYNQIVPEDTKHFKQIEAEAVDQDGISHVLKLGGSSLLALYVSDIEYFKGMMQAYQEAIFAGMPVIDEKKKPII